MSRLFFHGHIDKIFKNPPINLIEHATLLVCCIGSGIFSIRLIANKELWCDELITLITVRRPFAEGLLQLQDYAAPLYQLLLRLFIFDDFPPEWVIRAPAFLFAMLSLLSVWWLAKILFNKRVATYTLALVALNPVFITYSAEGRPYTLFLFFSVISFGTFYRFVHRGKFFDSLFYIISTGTLIYSHYYGFLVIFSQALYSLTAMLMNYNRKRAVRISLTFGILGLISLPSLWMAMRYLKAGAPGIVGWINRPFFFDLIVPMQAIELLGDKIVGSLSIVAFIMAMLLGILSLNNKIYLLNVFPAMFHFNWAVNKAPILLCVLWLINSLYLPIIISYFYRPIFYFRYAFPVMVPFSILLAIFICKMRRASKFILLLLVLIMIFSKTIFLYNFHNNDYSSLINQLRHMNIDQSPVFVVDWAYCDNFINPETYGLRYYGYNSKNIFLLKLNYPYNLSIREPNNLSDFDHFYVVSFILLAEEIDRYLKGRGKPYTSIKFGSLQLFEIKRDDLWRDNAKDIDNFS